MDVKTPSYIHRPVDFQYRFNTVPERVHYMAQKYGNKEIYVFLHPDGRRDSITARELYSRSRELAHSLITLGIRKGDIVATCLYNDLDLLICTFAVICTGAIILNTLIRNEDGNDLKKTLKKLDVKCLILNPGDDNLQLKACMNFIATINEDGSVECPLVPSLKLLIATKRVHKKQLLQLDDLYTDTENSFRLPRQDPDSAVVILPTSGSTGESKFVPHSHHDVMIIGHHLKESIGYRDDDVIYTERRIAWIGGFPFMYLHDCVKVVTKTKPFGSIVDHCEFTYKSIAAEKCSIACLFPATIIGLLEKINKMSVRPSFQLKDIHVGGLPLASACMNAIGILSEKITNVYGSTEGGFFTFNRVCRKDDYLTYSTGIPHGGLELKVVDDNGFVVERGEKGTVHVRSPSLFRCYYNDEVKTREVLSLNHWMNTDDVGYITDDGQLVITGRQSDIILQGGRFMIPSLIEEFIKTLPDVLDVIVISIPDDSTFEKVCACVIPFPGKFLTSADIEQCYTRGVNSFSSEAFSHDMPEIIMIFESFPTVYTGKPDKVALKKEVLLRLHSEVSKSP